MKRTFTLIVALSIVLLLIAENIPTKFYIWVNGKYTEITIDSDEMTYSNGHVNIKGTDYTFDQIDSITFHQPTSTISTGEDVDTVYITYKDNSAIVSTLPEGMTGTIEGANVSLNNTITDREIVSVLSGNSSCGSFVYTGDYKTTIRLDGLSLAGSTQEAINIKDGKRIALELAEGTVNTLEDATSDGGQKGAFYTKGHLEISGGGSLVLKGNVKHALSSKEYLLIKKTSGDIQITGAANDGIHAGEYVQINGGTITIKGVSGDGIQAEMTEVKTGEEPIEDNGKLIIKGGAINITATGNDIAALKADSTLHITGGNLTLSCSGNGSKAMKSSQIVKIEGGTFDIKQSGGLYEDMDDETSSTDKSYKVYVTTGSNNKYWPSVYLYKNDGTLVQQLTSKVNMTVNNQSLSFYYYDFKQSDSGTYYFKSDNYSSNYYGSTYTVISPTFTGPTTGNDIYYQISSSYTTNGSTRTFTMNTVTPGGTSTTEGDLSSSHGIKADAGVTISGGDITMNLSGIAAKGISTDKDVTITGGTLNITNKGAGQTSGNTSYTAKGISADGNVLLEGGNITINATGSGGKCVKTDGTLTIGKNEDGSGPTLIANTTGSSLSGSTSGNTGGWGGGPGGMGGQSSSGSSAKALKAMGTVYIYGGTTEVSTSTNGAEGLESKVAIYIEGGKNYFKCYDDCINSSGCIYFNGGITVCYGYGNDAIDSNAGKTGAITIGNGTVFCYTTQGSPEEGFDCDNNSYIVINGTGTAISAGGSQGGGGGGWGGSSSSIGSSTQGYYLSTSSISYTTGRYYTLADASGNNMLTYSFEANCNSSLSLFTASGMKSNSSYTIKYSTSAPTDASTSWHGLYLGSTTTGTNNTTSFTAK